MVTRKLKGKIVERFETMDAFAGALQISRQTVSNKLNGRTRFTQQDILDWADALGISKDEIGSYFFA